MKTAGDLEGGRTQKDRMNPNGARLGTHVDSSSCRVSDWYRAESRPLVSMQPSQGADWKELVQTQRITNQEGPAPVSGRAT